jgi:hypothetical protein
MSKETFKIFVKKNPRLIKYIKNGDMTWQKFYEMYDLYGEDTNVWKEYLDDKTNDAKNNIEATSLGLADFLTWLKTVNLDSLQEGIGSIQRVLGVVQDLTNKDTKKEETYKPRPLYKHFED